MSLIADTGLARETALLLQLETLRERNMLLAADASRAASKEAATFEALCEEREAVRALRAGLTEAQALAGKLARTLDAISRLEVPGSAIASDMARVTLRGLTEAQMRRVKAVDP